MHPFISYHLFDLKRRLLNEEFDTRITTSVMKNKKISSKVCAEPTLIIVCTDLKLIIGAVIADAKK